MLYDRLGSAVQQVIRNGVHVINFSISGGINPCSDIALLTFLIAYNAEILVSASAGNASPAPDTVNHRKPWGATVSASTSELSHLSTLTVQGSSRTFIAVGASSDTGISTLAPVVVNAADPLSLNPAAAGTFIGQIVVCRRRVIARVAKRANVAAGGRIGMILYKLAPNSLDADFHSIPAFFTLSRPFVLAGQTYNTIGMVSNGYAIIGGGTAADGQFINRTFPNPAHPNNTLGAFWTDLDGSAGGSYYTYLVGFGPRSNPANACWLILE
ncbi:PA domain-containing protein [Chloroflexus sp.]|uniref:PA domain-containing protein n=1 Tax=Chloroflexus sp. TaxID=1904827 RepID=UPI002ADE43DB|nr:PA domain-containing protein [Chloroflexus sp.]